MTSGGYREEVFNVLLALLLHERGVVTAPERSWREAVEQRRHVPDVLVDFHGLRTVIEGKVADQIDAGVKALAQAQERVNKGIAHIAVAVVYPTGLRQVPFADLKSTLAQTTFRVAVCSEMGQDDWAEGNLDYLADTLNRTYARLLKEDVVAKVVAILNEGLSEFARGAFTTPALRQQAAQIIGVGESPRKKRKPEDEE